MTRVVIVGAGPSGLALANKYCKLPDTSVVVIDKNNTIGGCHRVTRENGLFSEHGPRVYSSAYLQVEQLLSDMNLKFEHVFKKTKSTLATYIGKVFKNLKILEILSLACSFIVLIFNTEYGKTIPLDVYIRKFTPESKDFINRLCTILDGSDSSKFSLNRFLQAINIQGLYSFYELSQSSDTGLFRYWKHYLLSHNVDFRLGRQVTRLEFNKEYTRILSVILDNNVHVYGDIFILAVPPINIHSIYNSLNMNYILDNMYNDSVCMTFHWTNPIKLQNDNNTLNKSDWGIICSELEFTTGHSPSFAGTMISVMVSRMYHKSLFINKTVKECSKKEIIAEVFRQLITQVYNHPIVKYDNVVFPDSTDTAFVESPNSQFLDFSFPGINNLYNVGTHNGNSHFPFTSMESAVSNANALFELLHPECEPSIKRVQQTVVATTRYFFCILLVFAIVYNYV